MFQCRKSDFQGNWWEFLWHFEKDGKTLGDFTAKLGSQVEDLLLIFFFFFYLKTKQMKICWVVFLYIDFDIEEYNCLILMQIYRFSLSWSSIKSFLLCLFLLCFCSSSQRQGTQICMFVICVYRSSKWMGYIQYR